MQLIIQLANYAKHKDDEGKLHDTTKKILESFSLNTEPEDIEIYKSPIFEGLTILSPEKNLFDVFKIVITWRKKLWTNKKTKT